VLGTLRSAKIAEDFYGLRHPNRFTGEFDGSGVHSARGDKSGKGAYKDKSGLPKDMIGTPEEEKQKRNKEEKDMVDSLHKCDADDLTGQKGYCGAPLDKDDPSYKDGAKRTDKD